MDRELGNLDTAIETLEALAETRFQEARERGFDFSRDYRMLNELGRTLYERARQERGEARRETRVALLERAKERLEQALALEPEYAASHHNLSLVLGELGNRDQADRHRKLHEKYRTDDNAVEQAVTLHRSRNPAANHAAETVAIYDLQRPDALAAAKRKHRREPWPKDDREQAQRAHPRRGPHPPRLSLLSRNPGPDRDRRGRPLLGNRTPEDAEPVEEAEIQAPSAIETATADSPPPVRFTDVTESAGIDFVHVNGAYGERLMPETIGSGAAFLDYDRDGDQDLFLVNSRHWEGQEQGAEQPHQALYQNDGSGGFTDVTEEAGLALSTYGMGAAVGDFDGDGWDDLYLTSLNRNHLFRNQEGRFLEATATAGVAGGEETWSSSAAFFDYDKDGDLDLFVVNYVKWSRDIDLEIDFRLTGLGRAYGAPLNFVGTNNQLYRNEGGGALHRRLRSRGHPDHGPGLRPPGGQGARAWYPWTTTATAGWIWSSSTTRCATSCSATRGTAASRRSPSSRASPTTATARRPPPWAWTPPASGTTGSWASW